MFNLNSNKIDTSCNSGFKSDIKEISVKNETIGYVKKEKKIISDFTDKILIKEEIPEESAVPKGFVQNKVFFFENYKDLQNQNSMKIVEENNFFNLQNKFETRVESKTDEFILELQPHFAESMRIEAECRAKYGIENFIVNKAWGKYESLSKKKELPQKRKGLNRVAWMMSNPFIKEREFYFVYMQHRFEIGNVKREVEERTLKVQKKSTGFLELQKKFEKIISVNMNKT